MLTHERKCRPFGGFLRSFMRSLLRARYASMVCNVRIVLFGWNRYPRLFKCTLLLLDAIHHGRSKFGQLMFSSSV